MTDKKNTREPRLANIVEISRMGEKVVGQIDKRTGEITMDGSASNGSAPAAPKAKPKNVESDK